MSNRPSRRRKTNGGDRVRAIDPVAAEVNPAEESIRPARTIEVELKGGPLGHQVEMLIDGVAPKHVSKAVIVAEAGDILRLQTEQIKVIASVSVRVADWEKKVFAHASVRTDDAENPTTYIGTGQTVRESLLDLVEKIPEEALVQ